MTDAEDKTASLLAALWLRNRPVVEERMAKLDHAAATFPLREESRTEAVISAHKLAGSLGMYGYEEGTRIAREIELLLDSEALDRARLRRLIAELRSVIFA